MAKQVTKSNNEYSFAFHKLPFSDSAIGDALRSVKLMLVLSDRSTLKSDFRRRGRAQIEIRIETSGRPQNGVAVKPEFTLDQCILSF